MRAAAVLLAVLTLGCKTTKNVNPDDPKTWGPKKPVWVFVAPKMELQYACANDSIPPAVTKAAASRPSGAVPLPTKFDKDDILVPEELLTGDKKESKPRLPYSCTGRNTDDFFEHRSSHAHHNETLIRLKKQLGDSALFRSVEKFIIHEIKDRDHGGKEPYPFNKKVLNPPTIEKDEHDTGPIVTTPSISGTFYKVILIIRGYPIDPDIECRRF
jgi:hypothetical protein